MQANGHAVEIPPTLAIAGYAVLFEVVAAIALLITQPYTGLSRGQIQLGVFLVNLATCVLLGISAAKLNKSWLFYGVASAVLGPMTAAASFLMLWSHLQLLRKYG